jgi:diguanylate cyclase (GGDEF)-like protein
MTLDESSTARTPLSLVCFSLDDLQGFRRQYGFELGDQVLKHVENVASEALGPIHMERLDDDQLVALLGSSPDEAVERSERFKTRVGSSKLRFTVDRTQVAHSMTISLGIAHKTTPPPTPEEFVDRAAAAWAISRSKGDTVSTYQRRSARSIDSQDMLQVLSETIDAAGSDTSISIVQLDIDEFGLANKNIGQSGGDQLLALLLSSLVEHFGNDGLVGRLWSDEFLIILPDIRAEDAAYRAEDARRKIAETDSLTGKISLSVGVATYPRHAADAGELMRKAREARFTSRREGGSRTCVAEADQMITKTSHFSRTQLKRLSTLAKSQDRSEASILREGLDVLLQIYQDGAPCASILGHPLE